MQVTDPEVSYGEEDLTAVSIIRTARRNPHKTVD